MKKGDVLWKAVGERLDTVRAESVVVHEVLPNGQYLVLHPSGVYSLLDVGSPRMFASECEALLDWGQAAYHSVEGDVKYFEDHLGLTRKRLEEQRALLSSVDNWLWGVRARAEDARQVGGPQDA